MATAPPSPASNVSLSKATPRLYRPLGFANGYSFTLFLFFGGLMMFFSTRRIKWYIDNTVCSRPDRSLPGECYWFSRGLDRIGFYIHIVAILPAGFLACLQFIPALQRSKWALFHRISGYVVLLLSVIGTVGAMIIGRRAVGGTLFLQAGIATSSAMFIIALFKAYASIKRLQIDKHREWMLRAWFYAGFIVTMRPTLIAVAVAISSPNSPYYQAMPCKVIDYILHGSHERMTQLAPGCAAYMTGDNPEQWTAIQANWTEDNRVGEAAAIQIAFIVCGWVCFFIHTVGVEVYIRMTSAESERLKLVSQHRQMLREKGLSDGSPSKDTTNNKRQQPESSTGSDETSSSQ
ncbi:hypothetical protein CONLIGDRAFT_668081 [Coniochaeta ligniaria NRRL 30616]|uniref:Microtubule associated protein n=1 Tax=Coniochaeta ligniaria NRRL 30616 TaxID=1408157 RepID=A0A1J7IYI3_9PEZI|nr:hypothetical protein CONLIGDRAFT_668081 [Coniochaeta ligniaria NRRL 30616]